MERVVEGEAATLGALPIDNPSDRSGGRVREQVARPEIAVDQRCAERDAVHPAAQFFSHRLQPSNCLAMLLSAEEGDRCGYRKVDPRSQLRLSQHDVGTGRLPHAVENISTFPQQPIARLGAVEVSQRWFSKYRGEEKIDLAAILSGCQGSRAIALQPLEGRLGRELAEHLCLAQQAAAPGPRTRQLQKREGASCPLDAHRPPAASVSMGLDE
jgi:hypothetical protein